ncbi:unnamed protein product [Effrenium voratum]|nr:unnamed protein product [Effrenium voratum]
MAPEPETAPMEPEAAKPSAAEAAEAPEKATTASPGSAEPKTETETEGEGRGSSRVVRTSIKGEVQVELEEDNDSDSDGSEMGDEDVQALAAMSEADRLEGMNQFAARRRATAAAPETTHEDAEAKAVSDAFQSGGQAMLQAAEKEELPERSGWVKRVSASWMTSWQWRWLVLKDRRLAWFDGPDKKKLHGVIDFELLEVELEQLWEDEASASRPTVRRGKERGCRRGAMSRGLRSRKAQGAFESVGPILASRQFRMQHSDASGEGERLARTPPFA